jgi:hypothetical protein
MRHEPSMELLHHSTAHAQMSFDQGTVLHLACSDAGIPSCPSQSSLGSEAGTKCIKGRRRLRLLPKQGSLAHFNDYGGGVKRYDIPANKHQPPITSASHSAGRHEIFDPAPPPIAANSIICIWQLAPRPESKKIVRAGTFSERGADPVFVLRVNMEAKEGCSLGCGVWSTFIDNIILGKRRIAATANPSSPTTAAVCLR